jgi:UDP-2,3-diacylglucosamine hydrolase
MAGASKMTVTTPPDRGGRASSSSAGPLCILASEGSLPVEVAAAATAAGRTVVVIAPEGAFDERLADFDLHVMKWGQMGLLDSLGKRYGVRDVVLVGAIHKRPDFRSIRPDFATVRLVPMLVKAFVGGDDSLMANVARWIESLGYRVVGPSDVAPELVATSGWAVGPAAKEHHRSDAALAMRAARGVGDLDAGQAAAAVGGRVVALEGAEGTDAMIERVGHLREIGRAKWRGRDGVVAKCAKPRQDLRLDMPAIGPGTVTAIARAGLAGLAIEANRVMIVDRAEAVAVAAKTGTFIVALDGP